MRAVVLSAGYGTRLGDLTRVVPKAILPLAGRPLLEHVLMNLVRNGFTEIAVNTHFLAEQVRAHFGDGASLGIEIKWSHEESLLGTAGTLASLRDWLVGAPFLVHYGDILTDHPLGTMYERHVERGALATLLVHERPGSNSVVVLGEGDRLVEFAERPDAGDPVRRRSAWANSGICVCDMAVLELIPPPPADLARDVLPLLAGREGVYAERLGGRRVAVDSPERYREADALASELAP
jgi:NDP-sugar pyrophosphorylase family protein